MAEYIEREAFKQKYLCCGYLPEMSEKEFDEFPTADVAPVVRCRDCEYVSPTVRASTGERVGIWCAMHDILNVSPGDYCSRGLRKGGNYGAVD